MQQKIKVRATDNARCPYLNNNGEVVPGRFIGIDADGVMPEGELVNDHPQVRRFVARGQLELVDN